MQLPVPNVDRVYPLGAAPEQDIGETAGAGPKISADHPCRVNAKFIQCVVEFLTSTTHEPLLFLERNHLLGSHRLAGRPHDLAIDQHVAGHDEGPRSGPALCQIPLDHRVVETLPRIGHLLSVTARRDTVLECVTLTVAKRDRQGVGRVIGVRHGVELEEELDHELDLLLVGVAVT